MRLMNVKTFALKEFSAADIPHYAILSHRWEQEEVTFQDSMSGRGKKMLGWKKIYGCCRMALENQLEWVWIDSCCIDKSSSAELSEAINSMFRWYRDAEICYVYLSDVSGPLDKEENIVAFRDSKWFTKGWTLQELLAPDELIFFNKDWQYIGTKESLSGTISPVTGIKHLFNFKDASVAQKMSWAAMRETTRLEDQAYCLMGIFGINMPPLYGEGAGAFFRLQLEIIKISNDESLFAWEDSSVKSYGLLAPSPVSFRYASGIKSLNPPWIDRPPYSMTNKSLEISLHLREWEYPYSSWDHILRSHLVSKDNCWVAPLNCTLEESESSPLGIILSREVTAGDQNYQRVNCHIMMPSAWSPAELSEQLGHTATESKWEKIWVNQPQIHSSTSSSCYFKIDIKHLYSTGWEINSRHLLNSDVGRWGADARGCIYLKLSNSSAGVVFKRTVDRLVRMFMLKVFCSGKVADVALISERYEGDSVIAHLLQSLRTNLSPDSEGIVAGETRILSKSTEWGLSLKASVFKEGSSGKRETFVIQFV